MKFINVTKVISIFLLMQILLISAPSIAALKLKHSVADIFEEKLNELGFSAIEKISGKGGTATIYSALQNGEEVALKISNHGKIDLEETNKEIENFELLKRKQVFSTHLITLKESFKIFDQQGERNLLVFDKLKDLETFIKDNRFNLTFNDLKGIFIQMTEGVRVLHDKELIHNDIKPNNFLVKVTNKQPLRFVVKLADFATIAPSFESNGTPVFKTMMTVQFDDIDSLSEKAHSYKQDIWALGLSFITILKNYTPKFVKVTEDGPKYDDNPWKLLKTGNYGTSRFCLDIIELMKESVLIESSSARVSAEVLKKSCKKFV